MECGWFQCIYHQWIETCCLSRQAYPSDDSTATVSIVIILMKLLLETFFHNLIEFKLKWYVTSLIIVIWFALMILICVFVCVCDVCIYYVYVIRLEGRGTSDAARGVYKGRKRNRTGEGVEKRKREEKQSKRKKIANKK